jgi:hypothetical protein
LEQTASVLGVGRAKVPRLQAAFRQRSASQGPAPARNWGGRRNAWMTIEEERKFLAPWLKLALTRSLLLVVGLNWNAQWNQAVKFFGFA